MGRPGGRFDRKLDLYETIAVVASYLLMVVVSFRFVSLSSLSTRLTSVSSQRGNHSHHDGLSPTGFRSATRDGAFCLVPETMDHLGSLLDGVHDQQLDLGHMVPHRG